MDKHTLTIEVPADLYEQLDALAKQVKRPVQALVVESIAEKFGDLADNPDGVLAALDNYSDDGLWAVVHQTFAWLRAHPTQPLFDRLRDGADKAVEPDLDHLIERQQKLVLLRSCALQLLQRRGHDIASYLNWTDNYLTANPSA
jgi:predicted transcriptional regulator